MSISIQYDDRHVSAEEFTQLFLATWPQLQGKLNAGDVKRALSRTINVTAKDESKLVGCLRILSDGCLMSVICEIIVDVGYKQFNLAGQLLANASENYPRNLLFAVHTAPAESLKPWGWEPGYASFVLKKEI
jgi:hypothetical protein